MSDEAINTIINARRPPMRFVHKLLLIVFGLLAMGVLRTGFMFVLVTLLPSIIAYYMDVSAGRYTFKTIFACNLTGLMPYLQTLLQHGPSNAALQIMMNSMHTWIIIIGASLMGLLLVKICPIVAQLMMSGLTNTQINHIEHVQNKIEKEWGQEVTQFSQETQDKEADED